MINTTMNHTFLYHQKVCYALSVCRLVCIVMLMVLTNAALAQQRVMTGTITDSQGEPLLGVTVTEEGTNNSTISDLNGHYAITLQHETSRLTYSYVGFQSVTRDTKSRRQIDVTMTDDTALLDQVVVVGYAVQKKATVAAAVSSIGSDDLRRTSTSTTAGALVGKLSGVTARQKSGQPGSATTLQIRNMGSTLYVIDGIMKDEYSFNTLDISDIENISILKDGAAAIYGVKASNGVVLVTTKSGNRNKKTQVEFNTYIGWQQWTEYPQLLNAYEWKRGIYMRNVNDGTLQGSEAIEAAKADLALWQQGYYNATTGDDYRGYDWYDGFVNNAAPQYYINGKVSGGAEKMDYYLSLGHISQDAVFDEYNYNRTNLQANFGADLSSRVRVGFSLLGSIDRNSNPGLTGSDDYYQMRASLLYLVPTQRPYANNNPDYINYITPTHDSAHNMAAYNTATAGKYEKRIHNVQTNFRIEYDTPLKGLKAKALVSYYLKGTNIDNNEKSWSEYTYNRETQTYDVSYTKAETYRVKTRADITELTAQTTLNFDRAFAAHHITGVFGFEAYQHSDHSLTVSQSPVENPFVSTINTSENNTITDTERNLTTASWIFRAGYSYADRYIIDFAARYDASWRFPKNQRWGFFPSVSCAWRISEEPFYKHSPLQKIINQMKIRASYGEMGDDMATNYNSAYPDFAYMSGYTFGQSGWIFQPDPLSQSADTYVTGAKSKGIAQTELTWMKIKMYNIGIDLGFLAGRLRTEFDLFRRKRSGIPATPTDIIYPLEVGYSALSKNLNSDMVEGLDFSIKWNDQIGRLKYFVSANFTLARQKTLDYYGQTFYNAWDKYRYSQQDRWANVKQDATWMYEVIGIFQSQEEIDNYPIRQTGSGNNQELLPGDLKYKDVNGDGVIDQFDKRPLGYAATDYDWDASNANKQPLIATGLSLGLEWHGIDFAADFCGGFLNTWVPDWNVKWGIGDDYNGYSYAVNNAWHHQDIFDATSPWVAGKFPAVRSSNPSSSDWNNFYSKDVNYVRLRNLVVGYTLPQKLSNQLRLRHVRIYFEGSNLITWDSLSDYGFDPEISSVTGFDYPQHRTFILGLNITL